MVVNAQANANITVGIQGKNFEKFQQTLKKTNKGIKQFSTEISSVDKRGKTTTTTIKKLDGAVKSVGKTVEKTKQKFNFAWLSIMFGGMAVQRAFQGMFDKGFQTFRDLAGETNPLNQAMTSLTANATLLKFTLGEALAGALQNMMPRLLELMSWITDFIERHPRLASGFVLWGLAIGTVLFNVGQLMLFLIGLKLLGVSGFISKIAFAFWDWAASIKIVKVGMAAINTQLGVLKAAGFLSVPFLGWLTAILAIIFWLGFLAVKLGGVDELMKAVARGGIAAFAIGIDLVLKRIEGLMMAMYRLANAVGAEGIAGRFWDAANALSALRSSSMDAFSGVVNNNLALDNGPIQGYNPFSEGAFGGDSNQTVINNITIDGVNATGEDSDAINALIQEILRTQGSTQGVD